MSTDFESAIHESLRYLESDEAMSSLEANAYWPKWHSPWWHITLLHEMGLARRIPAQAIQAMTERLKSSPLTLFPVRPGDLPAGLDGSLDTHCHCGLGNIYQALSAAGVDVDHESPWIRSWFLRYQLPDGGLNCDNDAYLKSPPPSSMVGTVPPLEAVLLHTNRPFTTEEGQFLDRGAQFLIDRKLMHATDNPHNAEERGDEEDWLKPCFPRFYLYDVLRGLRLLLKWSDRRGTPLPRQAVQPVFDSLKTRSPDGKVRIERQAYEGIATRLRSTSGAWTRGAATFFPLLEQVSQVGAVSPYLTASWTECLRLREGLIARGLLI